MSRDRLNRWADLKYFDPVKVMRAAYQKGWKHTLGARPVPPPNLEPREYKRISEAFDAAAFACGLAAKLPKVEVHLAEYEAQDHDFVLRFGVGNKPYYCPLQLKQLVAQKTNPKATAESLLDSLKKYADASDLVVAIKIDRPGINLRHLKIPKLTVAEIWFFGPLHHDTDVWYLYGNCFDSPEWFGFRLPP